jgi:cell division protein FtsA
LYDDVIVGVDIGSSKVSTVIAKANRNGQMEFMGSGLVPCTGIKKGLIVDLESVSKAIRASVSMAEKVANIRVGAVYIGLSGFHSMLIPSHGKISFDGNMKEITAEDVGRVLKDAKDFEIPYDKQFVDVIPHQYIIDGYDEIVDPAGMMGAIVEVDADVVIGSSIATQSLLKSVERAGYQVAGIIIEAIATGEVTLSEEEKELGVLLVDIGGGKTDYAFFKGGRIKYYDSIPIGGEHITNDMVIGLKVSYNEADRLKKQFPIAQKALINNDQSITIYPIGDSDQRLIKISDVVEIIEARIDEIFTMLNDKITEAGIKEEISAGVVLVGQGIYHMVGAKEFAQEKLGLSTRLVNPKLPAGLKLSYVTSLGIIKYVAGMSLGERDVEILNKDRTNEEVTSKVEEGIITKFINFWKK